MSIADDAEAAASARRARPLVDRISLGALALTGSSALRLGLQFLMMPVLARLVGPSEYGLVALAMPFILLANVLSDGGLGVALGRQPVVTRELESTVFWIAAAIGATLTALCAGAALPIGWIMHQPRLPPLILALSPIMLINSVSATFSARVVRERRFGVFAAADLIATVVAAATAFTAALNGWGAWSLVAQQLVMWGGKFGFVIVRSGVRIMPVVQWREATGLIRFGINSLGTAISDFVSRNVDNLIVGAVLGSTQLGFYAMAYQIVRIPDMLISGPFFIYVMTAIARAQHSGDRALIQELGRAALRVGSTFAAPLFCGLALVADLAVPLVLGPKWLGAVDALRFLAGAGLCFSLCTMMAAVLIGMGRAGLQMRMASLTGVTAIVTVAGGAAFGLAAVSAALAGGIAFVCAVYVHNVAKELGLRRRVLAMSFAPAAVGCAAMSLVVLLARRLFAHAGQPVELAAAIVMGGCAYLVVLGALSRRTLAADLRRFGDAHDDARTEAPPPAAAAVAAA